MIGLIAGSGRLPVLFAQAASGGAAYPIPVDEMIHGVAVTEAIVRSAASGRVEPVG